MRAMGSLVVAVVTYIRAFFVSHHRLALENAALRPQLAVFRRKQPRPRLTWLDRLFWTTLRRAYSRWRDALIIVKPETVVSWHRAGYRLFWRWRSRQPGRPKVTNEIRELIRRMKAENPGWGSPRIHGELLQLGFNVSEPTVSRYLERTRHRYDENKAKQWLAFLNNHREILAAFDFFTVPTLNFRTLYCFFVIEHGRRRILHFNCTEHPTGSWIFQQLREALPLPCSFCHVLFDHDAKFGNEVLGLLKASGIEPVRTSLRSPWQNGIAERWVGSIRRELMDHVIPLNEQHLRRLTREYLAYYHYDRTHITLKKSTPATRLVAARPTGTSAIRSQPRVGGLHHGSELRHRRRKERRNPKKSCAFTQHSKPVRTSKSVLMTRNS